MKKFLSNLLHVNLIEENKMLREEVKHLTRVLDAEHRRAEYNEQFVPNL